MAENIQSLIEKINEEGVKRAEEKAAEIERQAKEKAENLLAEAKERAERLILEAEEKARATDEKEKSALSQAARDMLLQLGGEIRSMLKRLVTAEVQKALSPDALFKVLSSIIKEICKHESAADVTVSKEDLAALESEFLGKLKDETKKEIVLKSADGIHAGFIISFDGGRSEFDFSDKALAEYIAGSLKPRLKEILEG